MTVGDDADFGFGLDAFCGGLFLALLLVVAFAGVEAFLAVVVFFADADTVVRFVTVADSFLGLVVFRRLAGDGVTAGEASSSSTLMRLAGDFLVVIVFVV